MQIVRLPDGTSRKFGFVLFARADQARVAIAAKHGREVGGCILQVALSHHKHDPSIQINRSYFQNPANYSENLAFMQGYAAIQQAGQPQIWSQEFVYGMQVPGYPIVNFAQSGMPYSSVGMVTANMSIPTLPSAQYYIQYGLPVSTLPGSHNGISNQAHAPLHASFQSVAKDSKQPQLQGPETQNTHLVVLANSGSDATPITSPDAKSGAHSTIPTVIPGMPSQNPQQYISTIAVAPYQISQFPFAYFASPSTAMLLQQPQALSPQQVTRKSTPRKPFLAHSPRSPHVHTTLTRESLDQFPQAQHKTVLRDHIYPIVAVRDCF
jgi:hypothetical protein